MIIQGIFDCLPSTSTMDLAYQPGVSGRGLRHDTAGLRQRKYWAIRFVLGKQTQGPGQHLEATDTKEVNGTPKGT